MSALTGTCAPPTSPAAALTAARLTRPARAAARDDGKL